MIYIWLHVLCNAQARGRCLLQSILDLRIMRKDCKKEAKDFDNGVQELAYTLGQVHVLLSRYGAAC